MKFWLIVGGVAASYRMPPAAGLGRCLEIPDVQYVMPGQWVVWTPTPGVEVALVCVELPV